MSFFAPVTPAAVTLASLSAAPRITASAGVGQIVSISAGLNVALALPASGTWAYHYFAYNGTGNITSYGSGVAAGAAVVAAANASWFFAGFAVRQT